MTYPSISDKPEKNTPTITFLFCNSAPSEQFVHNQTGKFACNITFQFSSLNKCITFLLLFTE